MQKTQDNRVLARAGARSLTEQELTSVNGGFSTRFCTAPDPNSLKPDGDCD
jgi:hypothetical protein